MMMTESAKISAAKKESRRLGLKTYHGSGCKQCGKTERYLSNGGCVPCQAKRGKLAYELLCGKPTAVAPIREMTYLERRKILGEIETYYIDEKLGYDKGWSDSAIAEKIGTRRAWVAQLRGENFGPEFAPIDIPKLRADLADTIAKFDSIADRAIEVAEQLLVLTAENSTLLREGRELCPTIAAMRDRLAELEARG